MSIEDQIKETKFGPSQINKQPPVFIKRLRAAITMTAAGSLPFVDFLAPQLGVTPSEYSQWTGVVILATRSLATLFGVPDETVTNDKPTG